MKIIFSSLILFTAVLANGAEIRSLYQTGRCADVARRATAPNSSVISYTCNSQTNQNFSFNSTTGEISVYGTMCLAPLDPAGSHGDPIVIKPCTNGSTAETRWTISGSLIRHANGRCLDIGLDAVSLGLFDCDGTRSQTWGTSFVVTPPPTPPSADTRIKVLTWNNGGGDSSAEIAKIVAQKPQIVVLQEIDSPTFFERVRVALQTDQGGSGWSQANVVRGRDTTGSWVGIVSKYPLSNVQTLTLIEGSTHVEPCFSSSPLFYAGRRAIGASINVNGRTLGVIALRLTSESDRTCVRAEQVRKLKAWADVTYPGMSHIYGGDFNFGPTSSTRSLMLNSPYITVDSWAYAVNNNLAISYNTTAPSLTTPTRQTRLDYIFYDLNAPLAVLQSQIVDHAGLSDHRLMMTVFEIR